MNLTDFVQLGVGGVSVIVLYLVVKEFLKFTKKQEDNFCEVIRNHIQHHTLANQKLTEAVNQLLHWLKKSNYK